MSNDNGWHQSRLLSANFLFKAGKSMSTAAVILPAKNYFYPEGKSGAVKTDLICPECSGGRLEIKSENVKRVEYDNRNKKINTDEDFRYEDLKYGVHGVLECSGCREKIVFAGKINHDISIESNGEDDYERLRDVITIEYIERVPHILRFSGKIPSKIQDILINSYKLYWIDFESCANKIRICLEMLMDLRKIRKYRDNSRTKFFNLQDRIELFLKSNPRLSKLSEILKAIKEIGNSASHNRKITEETLSNCYQLLEYVLTQIYVYDDSEKKIVKIAAKINKPQKAKSKSP
jgi:hypothetical protein